MDDDDEAYILLLLSDGNLPTGSFVASAGLESFITHGMFSVSRDTLEMTTNYIRDSLATYARSALPFVSDAHIALQEYLRPRDLYQDVVKKEEPSLESVLDDMKALDDLYEAMTLNHVARRASSTQGVALLTLFSKGFAKPMNMPSHARKEHLDEHRDTSILSGKLIDQYKLRIRRGDSSSHLPVCWGVLTSALGLSLERSQFLHLFLHARSLLSASVRLNTVGPYAAQQLLLHTVKPLVQAETRRCADLRTGFRKQPPAFGQSNDTFDEVNNGPAMTWPLGEILAARHDLQHSRIFNS